MTKEEAKQKIAAILEKAEILRKELISLEVESYQSELDIEPYEGRDLITREQDEMQQWFYELRVTATKTKWAMKGIEIDFALLDYQDKQEG